MVLQGKYGVIIVFNYKGNSVLLLCREREELKKKKLVEERAKEQAASYLDGAESLLADLFKEDSDNGKLIHLPFWDEKREETAQKLNPDTEVRCACVCVMCVTCDVCDMCCVRV